MSVDRTDLDRYMTADYAELDPATDPAPVITDIALADRALRKIAEAERRKTRAVNYANEEIQRVGKWRDAQVSTAEADIAFWSGSLESWLRAVVRDGGTKTQKLPHGTARLRSVPPKVVTEVEPDDTAPEHLVQVKRTWWKTGIKQSTQLGPDITDTADGPVPEGTRVHQAITPDGEPIPGVTFWVTDEPSFSVTVEP